MKIWWLSLVGLLSPLAANADLITLNYESNLLSGGATNATQHNTITVGAPATGTLDASIVLNGSLNANNLSVVSFGVDFQGYAELPSFSSGFGGQMGNPVISSQLTSTSWMIDSAFGGPGAPPNTGLALTTSNGAITGATIGYLSSSNHSPAIQLSLGSATGDSYSYLNIYGCYFSQGDCPLAISTSDTTPGAWTVTDTPVPIPSSAWLMLSGLVGLGVMTQRHSRRPHELPLLQA